MRERMSDAAFTLKKSAIREFSALAKATPGCIALTLGEPDFDTPEPVRAAVQEAFFHHETHYIENGGVKALREKIAAFEEEKHGLHYSADEVIVTAGATEAIYTAFMGILNPGDEVIIPTPAFVLYGEIVKMLRGVPVEVDTSADGFQLTREKLEGAITEKTKAVIINTPNNPTGTLFTEESLNALHDAVADRGIFVLADDVYRELCYTDRYHSFAEFEDLRKQILVIQSFSKPYAMTGWRMGYLMADAEIMDPLQLIHQFTVASTPAPFQRACMAALDYDPAELKETYRKRRAYVLSRLSDMELPVTEPEGAFYVFPSIQEFNIPSDEFCRRMIREAGLAATPGSCFGAEGYIRLTYCYSDPELKEGLDRLERFIHILKKQ